MFGFTNVNASEESKKKENEEKKNKEQEESKKKEQEEAKKQPIPAFINQKEGEKK